MHDSELSTSGPHVTVGSTSTEISNNMMLCDTGRRRNGLEHESDLDNAWKSHGDQNDGHLTNLGILRRRAPLTATAKVPGPVLFSADDLRRQDGPDRRNPWTRMLEPADAMG
ncbi:MAG: hypothetical protein LQ348_001355 [Seirophora lacunosa]|nr:MAG: hypothetical protein LQ348_001355 [Seirophora lacunosa]